MSHTYRLNFNYGRLSFWSSCMRTMRLRRWLRGQRGERHQRTRGWENMLYFVVSLIVLLTCSKILLGYVGGNLRVLSFSFRTILVWYVYKEKEKHQTQQLIALVPMKNSWGNLAKSYLYLVLAPALISPARAAHTTSEAPRAHESLFMLSGAISCFLIKFGALWRPQRCGFVTFSGPRPCCASRPQTNPLGALGLQRLEEVMAMIYGTSVVYFLGAP